MISSLIQRMVAWFKPEKPQPERPTAQTTPEPKPQAPTSAAATKSTNAVPPASAPEPPAPPPPAARITPPQPEPARRPAEPPVLPGPTSPPPARLPYEFVVGLDFGTAFTKCIVRDEQNENAHIVPLDAGTYWLPSDVWADTFGFATHPDGHRNGGVKLSFLKMALVAACRNQPDDPTLERFRSAAAKLNLQTQPLDLVEAAVIHLLATVLRKALTFILTLRPDFGRHPQDLWSVNMAVPVAHADDATVCSSFERCLKMARVLAEDGSPPDMDTKALIHATSQLDPNRPSCAHCFSYPEVSANVQSFLQSRAVREGLYLFVDVGAGTVDLSIFIYTAQNESPLAYFGAEVLPLGSSKLESRAAARLAKKLQQIHALADLNQVTAASLRPALEAAFREYKETGRDVFPDIAADMKPIAQCLSEQVFGKLGFLGTARTHIQPHPRNPKGPVTPHSWKGLHFLYGGGGCDSLTYKDPLERYFRDFWQFTPGTSPLPRPRDLLKPESLGETEFAALVKRFTVAYGLSFHRANLPNNRLPRDITPAPPPDDDDRPPYGFNWDD